MKRRSPDRSAMFALTFSLVLFSSKVSWAQTKLPVTNPPPSRSAKVSSSQDSNVRRLEIRTAPLAYFARWFAVDATYLISQRFAIGPSAIIFGAGTSGNMFLPSYNGFAIGTNAIWYFGSLNENSSYMSAHIFYDKYSAYAHDSTNHNLISGTRSNIALGYRFVGANGFLIMLGAGPELRIYSVAERDSNGNTTAAPDKSQTHLLPYLEAKIGFAF